MSKWGKTTIPKESTLEEHGITLQDWERMISEQGGACAICHDGRAKLLIDHCHATGKVRGLVCGHCNSGLGFFRDRRESLLSAVRYLEKHKPSIPRNPSIMRSPS